MAKTRHKKENVPVHDVRDLPDNRDYIYEPALLVAILSRLGGRGYQVKEETASYGNGEIDFDPDGSNPQQRAGCGPSGP